MASLFELTNDMEALYEMATDPECDPQALEDTIEGVMGMLEDKAASCVHVIKRLEMEQEKALEVAKEFTDKATVRENNLKRIKNAIISTMDRLELKELKAGNYTIKIQGNGGLAPLKIDAPDKVPDSLCKVTVEPDNKLIRDYLKDHDVDWAHVEPRGRHITIK
jgi:hypothetical protein